MKQLHEDLVGWWFSILTDEKILIFQKQVGAGLFALGMGLIFILNKNSESVNTESLALIDTLSDAAHLLADAFHEQSETRKALLGTNLNSHLKETLVESKIDKWLFVSDLSERVKAAVAVEKSSSVLRAKNQKSTQKAPLNLRHPLSHQHRLSGQKRL
nr:unnamed protein product [Callosobruchus analis]